jgi:sugar lactone lactonase YvrE
MTIAEQITGPDADHGEGPVWHPGWGGLRWVDMLAGDVLHLDGVTGAVSRWHVASVAAALRPRETGGAVIATEHSFALTDVIGGDLRVLPKVFDDASVRFNDGACDPAGNFLCGTMAYDESAGRGSLYRLTVDGVVERVMHGLTISNGLAWTADGRKAFYVDTPTRRIDVFDSDEFGALRNRRLFVAIDAEDGFPDGLTVDSDGGVWVALWSGGSVRHYDSSGVLVDVIDVAARNVTACTFGGPDHTDLYITTSRYGQADPEAVAGALFRYQASVSGVPVRPYRG